MFKIFYAVFLVDMRTREFSMTFQEPLMFEYYVSETEYIYFLFLSTFL